MTGHSPHEQARTSSGDDVGVESRPATAIYTSKPQATDAQPLNFIVHARSAMTATPASSVVSVSPPASNSFPSPWQKAPLSTLPDDVEDVALGPQSFSTPPLPPPASRAATVPDSALMDRSPSPHTRLPAAGAMSDALTRSPHGGLIRRISRGAHNRLRRRASTTHSMRMRDQSAGPVIVRRRSDSNGASDFGQDVSDLDLDMEPTDEVVDDVSYPSSIADRSNPLGITTGRTSLSSTNGSGIFEGGIAPASSAVLENGTWLTKVTKRKTKRIKLWLDSNSARVCWHLTNPSKSFFVDDVREVRIGADSRNARDDVQVQDDQEARWVTIVYDSPERSNGRTIKTMHVVMPDDYLLKLWTDALNTVTRERIEVMNALSTSSEKSEKSMKMAWAHAMARKAQPTEEGFTLDDARWLCRKLEINCTDHAVRTHFKAVSVDDGSTSLDYDQYRNFVRSFRERKDIQHIYRNIKLGTDLDMDLETFLDFLRTEQMVDVSKDRPYWEGVFDRFARPALNRPSLPDAQPVNGQRALNAQSFQGFLMSSYNPALLAPKGEPTLDKPLNEYFISSSHNTYLLSRQVRGTSSVEGYIAALVKGCRCVEIDCWDGDDGRPRVTHGRTMTTKISFEDCVSVIAKYAFNSSQYPLIVSLEVHCNAEQQLAMVDLMKRYFHSMMVTEPFAPNQTILPSPEELKNRILIKVKASEEPEPAQVLMDSTNGRSRARSLGSNYMRTPSSDSPRAVYSPSFSSSTIASPSYSEIALNGAVNTPSSSADDSDYAPVAPKDVKKRTPRIIPELGKLGVYTQGIKFSGFQAADAKAFNHVFSFNENTFGKHAAKATDSKALLEKHNTRYLMRVYPSPRRIDSSNFNPLQAWRRGVQMAALNWQTFDVNQQVNEAMFAAGSDRFGYVLKPDELRHAKHLPIADTIAEAPERKEKKGKKLMRFTVDIISAQRLPRPRNQNPEGGMNPYIEFEMYFAEDKARGIAFGQGGMDASARDGTSGIGSPLRKRTRVVEGNGFDPQYHQPISMTVETKFPSLIFVRWTVWNASEGKSSASNSVLLATFTAKLSSLHQGYRHLPLFNPQGEQYRDAKLFVRIRKELPFPVHTQDNAYGIITDSSPSMSPRPDPPRSESSWQKRLLGSVRKRDQSVGAGDVAGNLSRTSSLERDSSIR